MRFSKTKKAFTLMEVNLAIFIMAVGLLAMVALYPLAYRESRQSQDDVKAAAAADCVLNVLTGTLSSRNIKWEDWVNGIQRAINADGWLAYCDYGQGSYTPKKKGQIKSEAKRVFNALVGINKDTSPQWPVDDELARSSSSGGCFLLKTTARRVGRKIIRVWRSAFGLLAVRETYSVNRSSIPRSIFRATRRS